MFAAATARVFSDPWHKSQAFPFDAEPSMCALPAPAPSPLSPIASGATRADDAVLAELFAHYSDGPGGPEELKQRYQLQAFGRLGVTAQQFSSMDPVERNGLINAAYARLYKSDPDAMKWAGMAAMASDEAGTGMMQSWLLSGVEALGLGDVSRTVGAPSDEKVQELLASGNEAIFNDMAWQHLAFQQGGLEELERAAEQGSLTPEQLEGWRKIARGKAMLDEARTRGDQAAIARAQDEIWGGNRLLLRSEQKFVQDIVYDESEDSRAAFQFLSGNLNPLGVVSPVPHGTSFKEHRMLKPGRDDVGDLDQRWDWIEESMLPEYRAFEGHRERMMARMDHLIAREHQPQGRAKRPEIIEQGLASLVEYDMRMEEKLGEAGEGALRSIHDWWFGVEEGAPIVDLPAHEELPTRSSSVGYEDPAPPPGGR